MHPLFCLPLWGKDRNRWRGKERELVLTRGGKRESHGQYYNHKRCPLAFSVDESKILCSNQCPCVGCTWMRHRRGHNTCDIWVCVCVCGVRGALDEGWWSRFLFWAVLFVCKWCALELGICIGMQDCLCQCDMLKHTFFFHCCHTVAVWRDTYRGSALYMHCLSPSTIALFLLVSNIMYVL